VHDPKDKQRDADERFKRALEYKYAKENAKSSSSSSTASSETSTSTSTSSVQGQEQEEKPVEMPRWIAIIMTLSLGLTAMVPIGLSMFEGRKRGLQELQQEREQEQKKE
jgi:hypothetical protein